VIELEEGMIVVELWGDTSWNEDVVKLVVDMNILTVVLVSVSVDYTLIATSGLLHDIYRDHYLDEKGMYSLIMRLKDAK
jgi:hypothetical protein